MSMIDVKKYRLMTKKDADELHHQIFDNRVRWARAVAPLDAKIAELKARSEDIANPFREEDKKLVYELEMFISNNKELFQSPRKPKTAWGNYGLQGNPEKLMVDDPKRLKESLRLSARSNLYQETSETKVTTTFEESEILKLLHDGVVLPGCRIVDSEEPKINIDDRLVDEAVKGVGK